MITVAATVRYALSDVPSAVRWHRPARVGTGLAPVRLKVAPLVRPTVDAWQHGGDKPPRTY
jgi:hypothetical protein